MNIVTFPAELHSMVESLAVATKQLKGLQAEAEKVPAAQAKVDELRAKLLGVLDRAGFTEEAVDLLLAAR